MAGGPFSEYEQRFLLAEVLKAANVPIVNLVQFLRDEDVEPNWRYVGLPAGRNVDECENTFESLVHHNELPAHNPNAPYTPGGSQSVRRAPAPGSFYAPSTRVIKPKPQYGANGGTPQQPYSGKKRGRPSKADLERRAQEAAAAADEGGMAISIGADGAVVAGQKRKMDEGDGEDEEHDLVQQAQGALAMPAAMMQVEGQPPVKRGRGRPRKIRPEEQMQHQQVEQQPLENQDTPDMGQEQDVTGDEMVLVEQLQHDAAQHPQHTQHAQHAQPEVEQEQGMNTVSQEDDGHAMRFFRGLQAQAQATGGVSHGHT